MRVGTIEAAAARTWDVVVIGAGPAGAMAALSLARDGTQVLLVDRAVFPREKVCGCCLSAPGAAMLTDAGVLLPKSTEFRGAILRCGSRQAQVENSGGQVIPRSDLDTAIVRAATDAGASFFSGCARMTPTAAGDCTVLLGADRTPVGARAVIAADGIGGSSLDDLPEFRPRIARQSYFGASVMLSESPPWIDQGVVHMVVGEGGYVGAVRLGDGRDHLAAALAHAYARECGGPAHAAAAILRSAGIEPSGMTGARWHGTPTLTRSRRVQSGRVFVIGDAAGYVEPFTGEGMTWAITGALAVVAHVQAALATSRPIAATWPAAHRRLLTGRHRACRVVTTLLRSPRLVRGTLAAGALTRALARLLEPRAVPA